MPSVSKHKWMISDGYYQSRSNGNSPSHESICVLNATTRVAHVSIVLYFENKEKMSGFSTEIPAERTRHIRMDKIVGKNGELVPSDTPYAIVVESDIDIAVQYTRLDTSQSELALMTTMAYKV